MISQQLQIRISSHSSVFYCDYLIVIVIVVEILLITTLFQLKKTIYSFRPTVRTEFLRMLKFHSVSMLLDLKVPHVKHLVTELRTYSPSLYGL